MSLATLLLVSTFSSIGLNVAFAEEVNSNIDQAKISLQQDKAAVELKAILSKLKTFSASFEQVVTDAQKEVLQEASGELILKQPHFMLWRVDEPDENLLVADGQTLWFMDPFVEQVVASNQSDSVANNPIILLTDTSNETWKQFVVNKNNSSYSVTTKNPQTQVTKLVLTFKDSKLMSLTLVDRQKQNSTLNFSNVKQNQPIADSVFEFSIPEGYDLDDQREMTQN